MKQFVFILLLVIFNLNTAFCSKVTLEITHEIKLPIEFSIYYYKNFEEKVIVLNKKINNKNVRSFQFEIEIEKFCFFKIDNNIILLNCKNGEDLTLIYNSEDNKWQLSDENNEYFFKQKVFLGYKNTIWNDSASFVKYHIEFMDSVGLDPFNSKIKYSNDEIFLRRSFYNIFVNRVLSSKLFKFPVNKISKEYKFIEDWADFSKINYLNSNYIDLETIRRTVSYNLPKIFNNLNGLKPGFYELLKAGEIWVDSQELNESFKIYLLGDIIQFFVKFNYPVDSKTISYLENFCSLNPSSVHLDFIKNFLLKKTTILNTKFEIEAVDLNSEKFEVSKYKEEIILIDFWATWCSPCIAANPYIEKIKIKYEGKVKVVKISIDNDTIKWERFIKDKDNDLKDHFILNSKYFELEKNKFNLESVPRYILINNKGKVLNSSAPSPLTDDFENVLKSFLN